MSAERLSQEGFVKLSGSQWPENVYMSGKHRNGLYSVPSSFPSIGNPEICLALSPAPGGWLYLQTWSTSWVILYQYHIQFFSRWSKQNSLLAHLTQNDHIIPPTPHFFLLRAWRLENEANLVLMYFENFLHFSESRLHPKGKRRRLPPYGLDTGGKVERQEQASGANGISGSEENTGQRKKAEGLLLYDWAQHRTKAHPVLGRLSIPYFLGIIFSLVTN